MKHCCENCGWSEIIGSPIMCNYSGCRTWRDECCEAWKPKKETDEKNMVNVVRCKDCRYGQYCTDGETTYQCFKWNSGEFGVLHEQDWYCADGVRKK